MEQDFKKPESPLKRVDLIKERPGGGPAELDDAALKEFQHRAQQAESSVAEDEEVEEDVPAPELGAEDLAEMFEMRRFVQRQQLEDERFQTALEEERISVARNKAVMEKVKESSPLRLRDFIVQGFLRQRLVVDDDYILEFQTVPSRVDILIEEVSFELLKKYPNISKSSTPEKTRIFIMQVLTLAAGLNSFSGKPMSADDIRQCEDDEQACDLLRSEFKKLTQYPTQLLQDLINFHMLFLIEVRKTINHSGYVADQAKKS